MQHPRGPQAFRAERGVAGSLLQLDPRSLLTPERLDYAVKWRYFRHLMNGGDSDAERLYIRHILERTGGDEPKSWKNSIEDYLLGCRKLLDSMGQKGFDGPPVRYGTNLLLIGGGAHRVSCAIALGVPIHATPRPKPGRMTWGRDWFRRHGFSQEELSRIEADLELMVR